MHWGPGRNPQCFKHYTQILERRKEGRRERGRKEGRGKKTTYSWTALPLSFPKVPTLRAGKEMLTLSAINDRKGKTSQNKCWTTFYLDSKETTSDFFFSLFPVAKCYCCGWNSPINFCFSGRNELVKRPTEICSYGKRSRKNASVNTLLPG